MFVQPKGGQNYSLTVVRPCGLQISESCLVEDHGSVWGLWCFYFIRYFKCTTVFFPLENIILCLYCIFVNCKITSVVTSFIYIIDMWLIVEFVPPWQQWLLVCLSTSSRMWECKSPSKNLLILFVFINLKNYNNLCSVWNK